MKPYLLKEEKKQIELLINNIEKNLYKPLSIETKNLLYDLIKQNRDSDIDTILNNLLNSLILELKPLLDQNLTKGLQFGIKNNNVLLFSYGGIDNHFKINEQTLFSFDSISKILTSIITMYQVKNTSTYLNTRIKDLNSEYPLTTTIKSILNFTANIKTEKRIENLSKEETIYLLKHCREILSNNKEFYEYNDIGFMIVRQTIPNFIEELNHLLKIIDYTNLSYSPVNNHQFTGGKINEEYITPDLKGRDIIFPGHTGLYGNIEGLLNLFDKLSHTSNLLTSEEKNILYKQPYKNPIVKNIITNQPQYINKIAGIYRMPNGVTEPYDKLKSFNVSNHTTSNAIASAGTCGSWVASDNLNNTPFGKYTIGLLTNPYSYVENRKYENHINQLDNTPLKVNEKGKIINYPLVLSSYKSILTNYAIILSIVLEYINLIDKNQNQSKRITKKII